MRAKQPIRTKEKKRRRKAAAYIITRVFIMLGIGSVIMLLLSLYGA